MGHYNVGSVVTGYRLDCPGLNPNGDKIFDTCPHLSLHLGVQQLGHPPPSSSKVKERVELYAYSTSGPSWPVLE